MICINDKKKFVIEELLGSKARIKILKELAHHSELTISLIIKKTRLNHSSVINHLNYLKRFDLVQEKRFGRIRIYRFKIENLKANSFKKFLAIWEDDY